MQAAITLYWAYKNSSLWTLFWSFLEANRYERHCLIVSSYCCSEAIFISRIDSYKFEVFFKNPDGFIFSNDFTHFVIFYNECFHLSGNLFCGKIDISYVFYTHWSCYFTRVCPDVYVRIILKIAMIRCNRMQLPTPARHPHRPAARVGRLGPGARKRWLRFLVKNASDANENVRNFSISFDKYCTNEMLLVNSIYFMVNILYFNIYFKLEYLLIKIWIYANLRYWVWENYTWFQANFFQRI